MQLLMAMTGKDGTEWLNAVRDAMPGAQVRSWTADDDAAADYALVWRPDPRVLKGRHGLKAVFNMGAGADALLALAKEDPELVPESLPVFRIEDAGMAGQMAEYALYAALRHLRRFREYELQQRVQTWRPLRPRLAQDFNVGILGLGSLGAEVARRLVGWGFNVRGFSRREKDIEGVQCFAGDKAFDAFLTDLDVLINLLPATSQTHGILEKKCFSKLRRGALVVNLARGSHLVQDDLLDAVRSGQVGGAMLDVFSVEPLPSQHPFWSEPAITLTPHISAVTQVNESAAQVSKKIAMLERGMTPGGRVDFALGY
ncbi:glyoxylate/hydroxypyruvate reductase A [Paraburkholderia ginsengiterrae]|uniref:Glyoxylate/hydroxypyruvate reductase A n=1 Tax=Paraburkholderia ginsengiterrae TaxID=1462993 RepID=A0A1A9MXC8_9BURK|nr:glyoxylate/hydroxypyruvate reductase A [Paraburkholderia ginsengiterrae]OAJ52210.1 glyoxylate/hydroxypyruvate reductase A [Paraburkholderia ginsengiterrae]OAJ63574.1 glyoxylate/hydroxypyruvate reductase A [Paraburkholderia ginsengiterrae]